MATTSRPLQDAVTPGTRAASALLTLWLDKAGAWHASVVLPDGRRLEFSSPFELARWSRAAVLAADRACGSGLR